MKNKLTGKVEEICQSEKVETMIKVADSVHHSMSPFIVDNQKIPVSIVPLVILYLYSKNCVLRTPTV